MIYFLYGEDSYRAKKKLEEIIGGYKKVHKSGLNLIYIDAKNTSFQDFVNNFRTTSMFAEKKLVVLNNVFSGKGGSKKFQEDFLSALGGPALGGENIVVVFEDGLADQRTKLFKALQKNAKCQEFKFLQPAMLKKWIAAEFAKNNSKIDPYAENVLLGFVGGDLWQMDNEVKKLSSYKAGNTVTRADVELLVRPNIESDIFKTIDALALKNKKQALSLLHQHLENGDNALYLLSMIAYQFRNLLIVKELQEKRKPLASCGLHPFVVKKSSYLCNQFSFDQLKKIYQKIFETDADIKTGKMDPELALDMLVSSI